MITANTAFMLKAGNASNVFLNTWGSIPYSELPSFYFVFPDTVSAYKLKN
jgi:hypothetical protein